MIINVIDIQKGKLIAEINANVDKMKNNLKISPKKMEKLMNEISYVYYDEIRHEIISGHESGSIVIWK